MDAGLVATPLPLEARRARGVGWSTPSALGRFAQRLVAAGSVLVPEGRRSHSLMVVTSGVITLTITGRDGRRSIVGLLGPGDVLGEAAALWSDPERIAPEVRMLTASTLIPLSPHELHRLITTDPSVAIWLIQALARTVTHLHGRLAATLGLGVRDRSLALLQDLASRWGQPSPRGRVLDLPLSQEAMAAMVGVSRESLNRALRSLRTEGLVLRSGRRYVLPDPGPGRSDRPKAGCGPQRPPARA